MNSETFSERQRILQAERQRTYRERRRQTERENIAPSRRKEITDEINEISSVPKARVYPWISFELCCHTLGNMTYRCNECETMIWLNERVTKLVKLPVFSNC